MVWCREDQVSTVRADKLQADRNLAFLGSRTTSAHRRIGPGVLLSWLENLNSRLKFLRGSCQLRQTVLCEFQRCRSIQQEQKDITFEEFFHLNVTRPYLFAPNCNESDTITIAPQNSPQEESALTFTKLYLSECTISGSSPRQVDFRL